MSSRFLQPTECFSAFIAILFFHLFFCGANFTYRLTFHIPLPLSLCTLFQVVWLVLYSLSFPKTSELHQARAWSDVGRMRRALVSSHIYLVAPRTTYCSHWNRTVEQVPKTVQSYIPVYIKQLTKKTYNLFFLPVFEITCNILYKI